MLAENMTFGEANYKRLPLTSQSGCKEECHLQLGIPHGIGFMSDRRRIPQFKHRPNVN